MSKTRKSVVFSSLSKFGSIATSLVLVVVVTRWLMPTEIGAFAVAYAVITLLEPIRQVQLTAYMIQVPALERSVIRAVHYVGWVMNGAVVAASLAAAAVMIGVFDQDEIGRLLLIMIPTFIIGTLVQPALGALSREMRFGLMASVEIGGAVAKAATTICLLVLGFRAEALAIGIVIEIAAKLAFLTRVDRRIAFAMPGREGAGDVWQYCLKYTGAELVNRVTTTTTEIAIGSFLGLAAAGFYNRASVLVRNLRSGIEGAIVPVALSAFAKSNRSSSDTIKRDYLTGISLLTGITWSGLAVFIVLAEPIIMTVFGSQWTPTIQPAQVISAAAIIHSTTAMAPALLASMGRVQSLLIRNVVQAIPNLIILAFTIQFDLMAVVWGQFLNMLIHFAINQSLLWREAHIGPKLLFGAVWRSAVMALTCAAAAFATGHIEIITQQPPSAQFAVGLAAAAVGWMVALVSVGHPLLDELLRASRAITGRSNTL